MGRRVYHTLRFLIRHRRLRRAALARALAAILFSCLIALLLLAQTRAAPDWWLTIRRDDPATIRLGTHVENDVINRAYRNRPADAAPGPWRSEPWTVEVSASQVNAWLNVRLPKWMANQKDEFRWPKEVTDLQVDFTDDKVTIGLRIMSGDRSQVVTATLEPRLEPDGRLFLPARWVNVGRLPIPADWVLDHAHKNAATYIPVEFQKLPETEALFRAFEGNEAIIQRAVVRLSDGRRIRILGIEPGRGTLRITCQTELQ